eukprot:3799157-Rhodomonas_salina.2
MACVILTRNQVLCAHGALRTRPALTLVVRMMMCGDAAAHEQRRAAPRHVSARGRRSDRPGSARARGAAALVRQQRRGPEPCLRARRHHRRPQPGLSSALSL